MKIVALAGGVGAARFLSGLVRVAPPEDVTVVVNTGDDFRWMGLFVCPDIDTVTYTLSGQANPQTGWGVEGDSFRVLDRLRGLGGDDWFRIGDLDLATHLYRTEQLRIGKSLSEVTQELCSRIEIRCSILPMTDVPVPTLVHTTKGPMPFQEYFVRRKCTPPVQGFSFEGIGAAKPAPGVTEALRNADTVIICPSNPFISIGPILAVPGLRETLCGIPGRIVAVTPIIAGEAVKGPTAAMLSQLGHKVSASGVANLYADFIDGFVLDKRDEALKPEIEALAILVHLAHTLMDNTESRISLARSVMEIFR